MIFWHLGLTTLIVRYVFRDPAMDLRFVLAGSLLPDVIDKPVGAILWNDTFHNHRLFAHALLTPVVLLVLAMVVTRRGSGVRRAAIAVVIGCFIHLVLDGVWTSPEAFLWPVFGLEFPRVAGSDFVTLVADTVRSPYTWVGEAIGVGYLLSVWRRHLSRPGDLVGFVRTGRVPMATRGA